VIALALLFGGLNGCTSSGSTSSGTGGTPPNTYAMDVTISAGTLNVVVLLTVMVTQ
jgi:hypothetical protein